MKEKDSPRIIHAVEVARKAHEGQFRKTGEPYIVHPLAVKKILEEWGMDEDTIIAGILHDTIEDTSLTLEDIRKEFGESVAFLVDGVLGTVHRGAHINHLSFHQITDGLLDGEVIGVLAIQEEVGHLLGT